MSCLLIHLELSGVITVDSIKVELMTSLVMWIAFDVPLSTFLVAFVSKVLEEGQNALVV